MTIARWTRTAGILGLTLAVCGGAIGCSKEPQQSQAGSAAPAARTAGLKIAMIAKSSTNPVFLSARTGAEAAAKELSEKNKLPVTIEWLTPPSEDGQVQAQRIAQAVNEGASAILISCSDAGKVNGAINDAVARGVPVMTFDSDAPDSKRFAFYGVDDIKTGQAVMDELAKQMGEKGNIAILAGNQNAPNLRKRVEGVKEAAKKYPDMKVVETFYHIETPQDAAAEVVRAQNAYPQIQGWAMIGGWPLFTQTLLTDLDPKKVKIVAVDGLPAELPYVEKGLAPVLLAQPTYQWGYVSVNKIFEKVQLKQDVPMIMPMDLVRVSKENLGTWARQLKDWGFTDVDEKYLKMQ
jgi:ribose transport system substrate-binding protein